MPHSARTPPLGPREFNAACYFVDRNLEAGRGGNVAIECGRERVTYEQLQRQVNRVGNALRSLGVRMEERVLLLLLDTPEFAFCFFGAIKIGAVPVPVNTLLQPDDYRYLLNDCRARVAIVSQELLPNIEAIPRQQLPHLETIVVAGEAPGDILSLREITAAASPDLAPASTTRDDSAFWLYSSGSTGPPKGCVHLQHDMTVCAESYARGVLSMTAGDRCFSVAKLFFAYGLGNGLYFPLSVGATSILWPGRPRPADVFAMIERHRPTLLFSVPTGFTQMLAHQREGADFDLSSLRFAISAGEALPAAIFHRFKERFGVEILDAIGSTEATHMFIANRPGAVRPGSSGQVIAGCEARVVDEQGRQVPYGEVGDLLVKTDAACAMYWNQHERSKDTFEGHWLRTGDKYYQDRDGYFWYAGRSDDMLKVSAVWVSPVEIENVIVEHPAVAEAAVVGRNDSDDLLKPVAYVVLAEGKLASPQTARELEQFVAGRLPRHKRPRWIEFVSELPKTATGKLQRFKLRQRPASQR
jgi:benzoate-CoA ligase family protein